MSHSRETVLQMVVDLLDQIEPKVWVRDDVLALEFYIPTPSARESDLPRAFLYPCVKILTLGYDS